MNEHADAYLSLFERSGICMARVDHDLLVREANEQFSRDLGGELGTVVGRELFDFMRQGGQAYLRRRLVKLANGQYERITARVLGVRSGDCLLPAHLTAVAVRDSSIVVMLQWDESTSETAERTAHRKILSELDARILEGVARGMSADGLAASLYLSRQGVAYHVGAMLKRLKAANRTALVARAYSMGILQAGSWPPRVEPGFIK